MPKINKIKNDQSSNRFHKLIRNYQEEERNKEKDHKELMKRIKKKKIDSNGKSNTYNFTLIIFFIILDPKVKEFLSNQFKT